MPTYKDYISQAQQYMAAEQAKDPAFLDWQQRANARTADMGPIEGWTGTDYFGQWLNTLSPESRADYLKQMNDSSTWQNKVGGVLKVAIPAAVGGAGLAATGLLGSGLQAAVGGAPLGSAAGGGASLAGAGATGLDFGAAAEAGTLAGGGSGAGGLLGGAASTYTSPYVALPGAAGTGSSWLSSLGPVGGALSSAGNFLGENRGLVSLLGGALAAAGSKGNSGSSGTASKTYAAQPGLNFGTLRQTPQQGTPATFTAQPTRGLLNSGLARYGATGGLFQPAQYAPTRYTWGQ